MDISTPSHRGLLCLEFWLELRMRVPFAHRLVGGEPMLLDRLMLLVDAVLSLGIGFTGLRIPFCSSAVTFLAQNIRLVQGMLMLIGMLASMGSEPNQSWFSGKKKPPRAPKRLQDMCVILVG